MRYVIWVSGQSKTEGSCNGSFSVETNKGRRTAVSLAIQKFKRRFGKCKNIQAR